MIYQLKPMPDCCWKYLRGVNQEHQSKADLKKILLKNFNDDWGGGYKLPAKLPGAIMFCGAYGNTAYPAYEMAAGASTGIKDKKGVLKNLDFVIRFFEDENCGTIVDMPEFHNSLHNSTIAPGLVLLDASNFGKALKRWAKEFKGDDNVFGANW